MSDQSATTDREPVEDLVEVQVCASAVSYFTKEAVLGPDGEQEKDAKGDPITVTLRHEAMMGSLIKVHPREAQKLADGGFVREPSNAPLGYIRMATPFTTPLIETEAGPAAYPGPVMGDPRPNSADEHGREAERLPLTADQQRELAEIEAKRISDLSKDDSGNFDVYSASTEEVQQHIESNKLGTKATLALAKENGEYDENLADKVLEAELAREAPRVGVTDELEKVGK